MNARLHNGQGETRGAIIVDRFVRAGMRTEIRAGRTILTWKEGTAPVAAKFPDDGICINPTVTYPKPRVRKFMEQAGITPEKWSL